jgi:hypothetical protein
MIFLKSARADVKIHQNTPSRFGQIRQKSARNPPEIRMILGRFSPKGSFCGFFCADFALSQQWPRGKYLYFFENIFQNIYLFS